MVDSYIVIGSSPGVPWTSSFNLPDGTSPSIALDFINYRFFDGSNIHASLASLVSGNPTIDDNGMLCNAATFTGTGALLTAMQTLNAVTVRAETSMGVSGSVRAIFGIQSAFCPLFGDTNISGFNGNTISVSTPPYWPWTVVSVAAWDASGRSIGVNAFNVTTDNAHGTYPLASVVTLGSTWGIDIFGGYLRNLAIYPVRAAATTLQRISWVQPYLAPLTGSHCVNLLTQNNTYISPGPKLQYERTQAWTVIAAINILNMPGSAAVIFTNVASNVAPWFGYELWVDNNGFLRVRLMGNWDGNAGHPGLCGLIGSVNVADGRWHTVAATYDGSSTAAGIKLYEDGVLDASPTVEQDNLSSTIVSGTPDFWIGNQINTTLFQIGALDNFVLSNVVRSSSYIAANVNVMPAVDANTQLSYAFEEGSGTTTADGSANGFTGTLFNGPVWVS